MASHVSVSFSSAGSEFGPLPHHKQWRIQDFQEGGAYLYKPQAKIQWSYTRGGGSKNRLV